MCARLYPFCARQGRRRIKDLAMRKTLAICVWLLAAASAVYGQAATASVDGTVLDSTGAAVPAAEVIVANSTTGIERRVQTSGAGLSRRRI